MKFCHQSQCPAVHGQSCPQSWQSAGCSRHSAAALARPAVSHSTPLQPGTALFCNPPQRGEADSTHLHAVLRMCVEWRRSDSDWGQGALTKDEEVHSCIQLQQSDLQHVELIVEYKGIIHLHCALSLCEAVLPAELCCCSFKLILGPGGDSQSCACVLP